MRNWIRCFGFAVLFWCGSAGKLPSDFKVCSLTSKDTDVCLKDAIQDAIVKMKDGLPQLKVPPLEPISVPSMTIGEGEGAVHVIQNFRDIKLFGVTKSNVTKVDGSKLKEFKLYAESISPFLRLEAKYNISGRILLLPIQGDGDCTVTLYEVVTTHTIIGEKMERKGDIYMKIKQYDLTLQPAKLEYNLKNLFNGNERLGKEMNNVLNENWKEVFEDVKEGYEEAFGTIFKSFAEILFHKVPFKDIFLE